MADHNERWVLNHLIEMCRDERMALEYAADHVKDPSVKALFAELAAQRAQFAEDLVPYAQRLGGAEAAEGTKWGALHRSWMALKGALVTQGDKDVIRAADHGEELALATYESALHEMLPPTARDVVERQWTEIRQTRDRVRAFLPN